VFLKLIALFTACLLSSHSAFAQWLDKSNCDFINNAELIIQGTFVGSSVISASKSELTAHLGVIKVTNTIKGEINQIVFIEQPLPNQPRRSSDLQFKVGDHGIWLLKKAADYKAGLYNVSHPQHFIKDVSSDSFLAQCP
jgi:hypothetical protein